MIYPVDLGKEVVFAPPGCQLEIILKVSLSAFLPEMDHLTLGQVIEIVSRLSDSMAIIIIVAIHPKLFIHKADFLYYFPLDHKAKAAKDFNLAKAVVMPVTHPLKAEDPAVWKLVA